MKQHLTIIGGGAIGQALAHVLRANKSCVITIWDEVAERRKTGGLSYEALIGRADIILLCLPTTVIAAALGQAKPYLRPKTQVVTVAKGIEPNRKLFMDQLLATTLPKHQVGLLYGPMLAAELQAGRGGAALIASRSGALQKAVVGLFQDTEFKVTATSDVRGVAVVSALKNVYAVGYGIIHALDWRHNRIGALTSQAINETAQLVTLLGGKTQTVYGLAGLGDLIATGLSEDSFNHRTGRKFVNEKKQKNRASEGVQSARILKTKLGKDLKNLPFFQAIVAVAVDGKNPEKIFEALWDK